jgi:TonB family protein
LFQIVTAAPRTSASSLAVSAAVHIAIIVALFTLGFPGTAAKLLLRPLHVTLIAPAPEPPPRRAPKPVELPAPRLAARVFIAPKPAPATLAPKLILDPAPAPAVETARLPAPLTPDLPRVAPPVKIGTFSESIAPAPAAVPPTTAKPAGFTLAETSSSKPQRAHVTAAEGFDAASTQQSGSHRGTPTTTAGFGEVGVASASTAPARASAPSGGSFGDASLAAPTAHHGPAAAPSAATPVEILEKPRPAYTEEARRLSLEGEVLLEVTFAASGEARVLRVVHTLGHGLDESAATAARSIRFRPARRDGIAVDSTALVHIVFQLAY